MDVEAELLWLLRGVVGVRGWHVSHDVRPDALDDADEEVVLDRDCRPLLVCGRPCKGWAVHEKLLAATIALTLGCGAALGVHLGGRPLEISFGPNAGRLSSVLRRGRAREARHGAQKGEVRSEPILLILLIVQNNKIIIIKIEISQPKARRGGKPYLVLVKRCSRL